MELFNNNKLDNDGDGDFDDDDDDDIFLCLRTPVERTRHVRTTPYASPDLQARDIDVCAILDSQANTATRVLLTCSCLELGSISSRFVSPRSLPHTTAGSLVYPL